MLLNQIKTRAHVRLGRAPSSFRATLARDDSELAQQLTKDPYVLDFLAIDGDAAERELEQALVDRIISRAGRRVRVRRTPGTFRGRRRRFLRRSAVMSAGYWG
jgi:hypothetical protein